MYSKSSKTFFRSILATLVIGVFIFNSCSDNASEEFNTNSSQEPHTSLKKRDGISPDNPSNPWEIYGIVHNEILQEVLNHQNFLKNDTEATINFSLLKFTDKYNPADFGGYTTTHKIMNILKSFPNSYYDVVESHNYSPNVKNKLNYLFELIYTSFEEEGLDYNIMKGKIVAFEETLLNGSESLMSDVEKDIILKTTSIGRHSLYFWFLNTNEKYPIYDSPDKKSEKKWWKWLVIGAADVAGAVTGNVAGALGASAGASTLVDEIAP